MYACILNAYMYLGLCVFLGFVFVYEFASILPCLKYEGLYKTQSPRP